MQVYVAGVMLINFLVDFLLLEGTNRLAGYPSDRRKLALAAALGAAYSGICLVPEFRFLGNLCWRMTSLGLMGAIAFGWDVGALRRCGVFVLLSLALGGFAMCIGRSDGLGLGLACTGLWCLSRLSFRESAMSREYVPLEIVHAGRSVKLLALGDTANSVRASITGEQALVIAPWAACRLTGLTPEQLRSPLDTMGTLPGLRLLPYRTVAGSGMMLAMTFETVYIDGKKRRALVAFAPEQIGQNGSYQALTGGIA